MTSDSEYSREYIFASLPRTTRGLPLVISGSPDGTKFLYCNGNGVFIRSANDIKNCDVYTEHSQLTTVARFSPSGFYICSGDQSGKIRLWDATQPTHILKSDYHFLSGAVRDIAFSDDSKRVAIVGEGSDKFGHVFLFDTGTSNGNLSGQSRPIISVDFRQSKPYRIISGSEDNTVAIFEGPPFKFKTLFHEHARFVNCVRYNKDGSQFCSAGADGKAVIFDGNDGAKIGEFVDEACKGLAHGGGIFALSWSPDSKRIVTASGDKTVKIWNAINQTLLNTVNFGTTIECQQVSVLWLKDSIISISLTGFINYIDPETSKITKIIKGHNKSITAMVLDPTKKSVFTADFEGNIVRWQLDSGEAQRVNPAVHKSQVSGLALSSEGTLISTGWDDTVAFTDKIHTEIENVKPESLKLSSQPRGVSILEKGKIVVVCYKSIAIFQDCKLLTSVDIKYEGTCASSRPGGKLFAIGGNDAKVRCYELNGTTFSEKNVLQHQGAITSVAFSPNGKYLVATDVARKVVPYDVDAGFKVVAEKEWSYHTARVNCSAWSDDNRYVATGGLDTNIIVWDIQNSGEHPIIIRGAHAMSPINCIAWTDKNKLISAGQDSNIRGWSLNL